MKIQNDTSHQDAEIKQHLESYIVGVSDYELPVNTSQEMRIIAAHMASQAMQRINIISRNLDRKIYSHPDFCNALLELIKKNPKAEVRILIHDPTDANQHTHLLVNLYQKLDSFIFIRRINEEYKSYNHAYISVDHTATIYREFADLYEGVANYSNRLFAKNLRLEFTKIWELSEPEQQFKNLHI